MSQTRITVLLIEDDLGDAAYIQGLLNDTTQVSFEVVYADRLATGLAHLARTHVDIILLDLSLPDSHGLDTLLAAYAQASHIPIIILTGYDDAELAVQAIHCGAQDSLVKGDCDAKSLTRCIRYAVERQAMRLALKASEERFRNLIRRSADGIIVVDREGILRFMNPAAEALIGQPAERLVGTLIDFPVGLGDNMALDLVRPGVPRGSVVEMRVVETNWDGDAAYMVSLRDVTARKRAEESLRHREELLLQAQKMEAVGRLAGGVAHDFNNLLTAIIGYSDIMLMRVHKDEPVHRYVDRISKAANRAALITRQLLAFSRHQLAQPQVLNVNTVVSDMQKMLQPLIGEDIEIITRLACDLGQVYADAGHIEQLVMNLVLNARDAMPQGGQLTIITANVDLATTQRDRYLSASPGPYVMLLVRDSGTGMDAATRTHLFEPFYTTKDIGKGTGLGLAVVYGILQQAGGDIEVISEKVEGATFKAYLPRVIDTVSPKPILPVQTALPQGLETVLVVEDEEIVRVIMHDTLQLQGYHVLTATDVQDAMRLCEQHDGPIHLLVTDMVMPTMSGQELAACLAARRSEMRVLFISGHSDDTLARRGLFNKRVAFLPKPFTPDALARTIRHILDAPRPAVAPSHGHNPYRVAYGLKCIGPDDTITRNA